MSILNDQQNDNLIKEENNDIKAKNEELEKIKKEIEEKTKYLNELNEEIKNKEKQKKMIIDTLNEDLSKIQEELETKQAEFITFNSDIENSKNIKEINDKYTDEKNKNIELNELYNKLIEEKKALVKKLETNKNIIEAKSNEIERLEKNNKMLNEIISQLKIETGKIKENLNKDRKNIIKLKKQIEEIIKENKNEISNNKNSNELEQKKIITLNIHSDNRDILGSPIKENSNNNNLIINNNKIYSYQCTNLEKLVIDIREKMDKAEIKIKLKNNGNIPWDKDTKLKMVELSDIKIDDIILKPQNPNTEETYTIILNLQNYEIKEYKTNLVFCSGGKTYGEKIVIKINILSEIDFCLKKIDEFKRCYNLIECKLDDEKILECLAENDFSFENTFSSLFC